VVVYPSWPAAFAKLAGEEGFPIDDVEQAAELVRELIAEIDAVVPRVRRSRSSGRALAWV
jgi:hypothetical protein